jgi:hypothetical protein
MRRLVVLLFLLLAAPASADAPWSDPAPASSIAHTSVFHPRVAFGGDGSGLVTWSWFDGGTKAGYSFALRTASGFGAEHIFAGGRDLMSDPATYAKARAVLAFTLSNATRIEVAQMPISGFSRTTRHALGSGKRIVSPVVAANPRGDIAVAWFDDRGTSNDRVVVATRRAGGSFTAPVVLATEKIRGVSVAVGERGQVLVAWDAFGKVRTRLRDAGGHNFHSAETITSEYAWSARLSTAVLPNGRAIVGWSAQFRSEGGDVGTALHQVAVRPAGARRFRTAQRMEANPALLPQDAGLEIAVDGKGAPVITWPGNDGANRRVRVSFPDASGVFGAPETVSPAGDDAVPQALAAGPDGQVAVLFDDGDFPADNRIFAAFRPAGGSFGAPEAVSPAGNVARPHVAFSPADGRPVAVWELAGRVLTATRG